MDSVSGVLCEWVQGYFLHCSQWQCLALPQSQPLMCKLTHSLIHSSFQRQKEQGQSWPYHYFDPVHFHTVWYNSFFHSCRPYLFIRSWLIAVDWEVSWVVRSCVVISISTACGKESAGIGYSLGFTPGSLWGKEINCWYLFFGVYILRAMFFILSGSQ